MKSNTFYSLLIHLKSICSMDDLHKRYVNLTSRNLTSIPDQIWLMKDLCKLGLGSNRLKDIPDKIGYLKNLKELFANDNEITHISNEICALNNLEELDLNNNLLEDIPDQIGNLNNLVYFGLENNHLKYLPRSVENMTKIMALNLKMNLDFSIHCDNLNKLGKLDLMEIFGHRVIFDNYNLNVFKNNGSYTWNHSNLAKLKNAFIEEKDINKDEMIQLVKKLSIKEEKDFIDYIETLYYSDIDYQRWKIPYVYRKLVINLLKDILQYCFDLNYYFGLDNLNHSSGISYQIKRALKSTVETIFKDMLKSIKEHTPNRQIAELKYIHSTKLVSPSVAYPTSPFGLNYTMNVEKYILNRLATLKESIFDSIFRLSNSSADDVILNYLKYELKNELGFDFKNKIEFDKKIIDGVKFDKKSTLEKFYSYFLPEYTIKVITRDILEKDEIKNKVLSTSKILQKFNEEKSVREYVEYTLLKIELLIPINTS